MEITVKEVSDVKTVAKGRNSWQEVTVSYDGKQGSKDKTLRSFTDKECFAFFTGKDDLTGVLVEIDVKKEGDYWNWKGATLRDFPNGKKASGDSSDTPSGRNTGNVAGKKGDWETSEERAKKQQYIIKQSSAGLAREYLNDTTHGEYSLDQLLEVASTITRWVNGETVVESEKPVVKRGRKPTKGSLDDPDGVDSDLPV